MVRNADLYPSRPLIHNDHVVSLSDKDSISTVDRQDLKSTRSHWRFYIPISTDENKKGRVSERHTWGAV